MHMLICTYGKHNSGYHSQSSPQISFKNKEQFVIVMLLHHNQNGNSLTLEDVPIANVECTTI